MILLRHRYIPRGIEAAFHQEELRAEDLIICRASFAGGMFDEVRNLPAGQRASWTKVRIVLSGHLFARTLSGGAVLGPGDMVISRGWDDRRCRALDAQTDYLLVGWKTRGPAGERPREGGPLLMRGVDARTGPSAHARDLAMAMEYSSHEEAEAAAAALMVSLAAFGLPVSPEAVRAVGVGIEPAHHRFARAMESTVFPLASRPMAIDLGRTLDVGDRQALRLANDFLTRFYVTVPSWRVFVRGMRLELGVFLSSNPKATTDSVSRALGFGSPAALCHAFQSVGMPSPKEVRRQLVQGV